MLSSNSGRAKVRSQCLFSLPVRRNKELVYEACAVVVVLWCGIKLLQFVGVVECFDA